MGMFCYQCQETAKGKGCEIKGVCGKNEDVAKLQDLLIYTLKGISDLITKDGLDVNDLSEINHEVIKSLFMTITNANFDEAAFEKEIYQMIDLRDRVKETSKHKRFHNASTYKVSSREEMLVKASQIGVLATENEDVRSLRELIIYGLKGLAAYTHHALNLGKENNKIYSFIYEALSATLNNNLTVDKLVALTLKTGQFGISAMALLDEANTSKYGNPEITEVNIGVKENPAILVSGHDLTDLEQLLEQTNGTGVDIYTHSEMLPAHYYPAFKKYDNFAGNYGNAWWKQKEEFESFNGPILFTTNCIVPPTSEDVKGRIFTTGASGFPGCVHIEAYKDGKKDFSQIIALAKTLKSPVEIKTSDIKKFFVMAGCNERMKSREYYTKFAKKLPKDTVILTAGCAKYRYNKLNLGDIGGIPRILDACQCNDSYSLALIALKLKEVFELNDINELPIAYNIAWYEQKAVIVLLALLFLGVKNIHLGPTLPAFLSPNVVNVLVNTFGIAGIGTVDDDISMFMGDK